MQQLARQQVPLRPERRQVVGVARSCVSSAAASAARSAWRSARARSSVRPGSSRSAGGSAATSASVCGSSRLAARRASAAAWCAAIQPGDLARGGGRIGHQARRWNRAHWSSAVAMPPQRRRNAASAGRRVDRVDPGLPRQGVGLGGAPGIGGGLGAAQHGRAPASAVGVALRQDGGIVGIRGDRLLAPPLQHRLRRPVRIALHEVGDLRRRRRAGRAQPQIQHQLLRHRIGEPGGGGLRLRPAVGPDRGQADWVPARWTRRRPAGQDSQASQRRSESECA